MTDQTTETAAALDGRMGRFNTYLERTKMDHKKYQYDGVRWIVDNETRVNPHSNVRGGFIADEMGLGKTIMMIGTLLCNFLPKTLIVVPPVLVDQWFTQIYRTTGHKALVYHGTKKRHITVEMLSKAPIVVTTYGALTLTRNQLKAGDVTLLHKISWDRIVYDEAHHLRNPRTTRHISAKKLATKIRWLVSGTPIQNNKKDFYSLCSMIGLPASFYTESSNLDVLAKAFILKRTKKLVGINMPDMIVGKNMVQWGNQKEKQLSEEIHSALAFSKVLPSADASKLVIDSIQESGRLSILLRARQTCIFPKLMAAKLDSLVQRGALSDYSAYKEAFNCSSKLDFAVQKILQRKDNGCGKLIFCHFREEIDEIAARLLQGGMKQVAKIDGRTSNGKRSEILAGKNDALILQIQTGCEGLNLQENYSEIYFISPHWNPAIEDQAVARCHRIGQKKTVYVERFEMSPFTPTTEQAIRTITADNYVSFVQDEKRIVSQQYIS